ncbi:MAG: HAD hydrolase-like protein [Cyanobacteriota bacterium]|nr:HAD hydrolase-like protein [Cyanobacteriota bacterium]
MTIQLVVFDMAGTTVHDNHDVSQALIRAFAQIGLVIGLQDTNPVMGYPKPLAVQMLLEKYGSPDHPISQEQVRQVHELYRQAILHFYETSPSVAEKDHASQVFESLRQQGIRVALDTGFDRLTADTLLKRLGWLAGGVIDASVTSDEVPRGRPYPDMIWEAMRRTGVESVMQVAKVGDTPSDLEQGSAAGCAYVIGITNGSHDRQALQPHPHTHLIDELGELLPILGISAQARV